MIEALLKGFCHCGCGEKTKLSPYTDRFHGWIKNKPRRYIHGHARRLSPQEYFVESKTGCWIWQRARDQDGYGIGSKGDKSGCSIRASRLYYESRYGSIPLGLQIDHLCRNRACVNPAHLEVVSAVINNHRGNNSKLKVKDISPIKHLFFVEKLSYKTLAKKFGVHPATIGCVIRGETWKNLLP